MVNCVKTMRAEIEKQRGPRLTTMDDYGNIKAALERAESVSKDLSKRLKTFWESAVEADPSAQDATLQRLYAVSMASAQNYAWLAAEAQRANE